MWHTLNIIQKALKNVVWRNTRLYQKAFATILTTGVLLEINSITQGYEEVVVQEKKN